MKPTTARTLIAAAVIADLVAFMVMSPTAWFGLAILAAIFAACPAIFARKGPQISGAVVLVLSIAAAVFAYPAHKKSMDQYAERVKQQAEKRKVAKPAPAQAPTPAPAQEASMSAGYDAVTKEEEPPAK